MTHPSSSQLSDYLDGELSEEGRLTLEAHLTRCAECGEVLGELRRVLARAQALEDRPPHEDLWPGVAAAIGAAPGRRWRVSIPVPVLLAASVALMLFSGGAVALALKLTHEPRLAAAGPVASAATGATPVAVIPDDARGYDGAIRALQAEVDAGGGRLDSVTVRIVNEKLAMIDRAIADAERALAADPANSYLHGHLTQTRLRKLDLLRRAAALTRSVS